MFAAEHARLTTYLAVTNKRGMALRNPGSTATGTAETPAARVRASRASPSRVRLSADERRTAIVRAAVGEFGDKGFEGTSTEAIARRSGVSQPYVFQLFGTKRDLFIAALRESFQRTRRAFEEAAAAVPSGHATPEIVLHEMGRAYCDLLRDKELLRCQLHAYAACGDADIQAAVRAEFTDLYRSVADVSGAGAEALDHWFAWGMLFNTIVALAPEMTLDGENLTLAALTAKPAVSPPAGTSAPAEGATAPSRDPSSGRSG